MTTPPKKPFWCRLGFHDYNFSYSGPDESYDHCFNCKTRFYRDRSSVGPTRPAGCFLFMLLAIATLLILTR